ncbi:MAG: hypothetical protein U9R08_06665 [Nanoarchaeota archaeon]|nr:hypothetical protein [Nanoarchaeota archaeon]
MVQVKRKDTRKRLGRYSAVNLPKPLCDELDSIVKKEGIYGSRAKLVVKIVQDFIEKWRRDQVLKHQIEKKLKKKLY